jgi:two-component system sensor histidine kinase EvgS
MMVHELRSPLDGIKKRIEVMKALGEKGDQSKEKEIVASIYENASHMLELVNDLLDAAKLESGQFQIRKEEADVRKLVQGRIDFFDILANDSNIELKSYFDPALPEKINLDPARVEQVLNNLISNALKFTENGGKIMIHVLLYKKGQDILRVASEQGVQWLLDKKPKPIPDLPDSLFIAVTDSGVGISDKDVGQLFNKFKQFRSTAVRKDKSGTGLGLYIAKGITERHGGLIDVSSVERTATTFYFTIPIN